MVRRIVLVKIAEIDQLDFLSDKMSRVASPSEELPISLADNLRQVHRYIAEEWWPNLNIYDRNFEFKKDKSLLKKLDPEKI